MSITLEEAEFLTAIGDFSDVILLIEEASHNKLWSVWFLDQVWDFLLQVIRFLWAWLFRKCILSYYPSSSWWCILYYQYHIFIICNLVWTVRLSNFTSPIILPLSNLCWVFLEGHSLWLSLPPNPHLPTLPWKKRNVEHLMCGFHWFYAFINFSVSSQFYCLSSLVEDPCIHYYILAKNQSSLKFIFRIYFCWELGASRWSHFLTVIINSILASSDVQ